mgnify:CR=1 FL=1
MIDILKSNLNTYEINFWYDIGATIQKRVNGIVRVLYCEIDNSIIIKISFNQINYNVATKFYAHELHERTSVLNKICDAIRFNIYDIIFK